MAYGTVKVDQITTSTQTITVDNLATTSSLSGYLTTSAAASTYLTSATAASTYLTSANASATYAPLDSPDFTTDITLSAQAPLKFADADSSNWVAFKAPATVSANVTWTLPGADGSSGQMLATDGAGTLSWATAASGGVSLGLALALG